MYYILDTHTDTIVGRFQSRTRARRRADRLDSEYGAVRYVVRFADHEGSVGVM